MSFVRLENGVVIWILNRYEYTYIKVGVYDYVFVYYIVITP
jgi:hypothetical protein